MSTTEVSVQQSFTVSVFTRHSAECPHAHNPQWKRCKCRKSLYIREGGETTYVSALTRSWEQADKLAQAERDKRDPVKIELARIADEEAKKALARMVHDTTVAEAIEQYLQSMKTPKDTTMEGYRSTMRKVQRWADRKGLIYMSDVTPAMLDKWRGQWSEDADHEDDQLKQSSQSVQLQRLKAFFTWATGVRIVEHNPALLLKSISKGDSPTMPLTEEQFLEVLKATEQMEIFKVQRWTGMRIGDVLKMSRTELVGNRITFKMQKNDRELVVFLPDDVLTDLLALPTRPGVHRNYFFWNRKLTYKTMTIKWFRKIDKLNEYLSLREERGEPMEFRSHMMRDTFAVEALLSGELLENVSPMLGHQSIQVTERYYAKWVKARRLQLEVKTISMIERMGGKVSRPGML